MIKLRSNKNLEISDLSHLSLGFTFGKGLTTELLKSEENNQFFRSYSHASVFIENLQVKLPSYCLTSPRNINVNSMKEGFQICYWIHFRTS